MLLVLICQAAFVSSYGYRRGSLGDEPSQEIVRYESTTNAILLDGRTENGKADTVSPGKYLKGRSS
jgi:hypothetical protein